MATASLSLTPPAVERKDEFDYDPKNPVPTIGGRLCCGKALPPGPADQRPNESRADVLVFSTPALTEDTEVTGFISLELYASTSAVDTDFTALLVDVDPSGYARFLTDGIVRARYREETTKVRKLFPAKSTSTRSTSGPRRTCSRLVTVSGYTFRAVTFRGLI